MLLTRLENESTSYLDIAAIASGLDSLGRAHEGADDERCLLTDSVERAEFDLCHGRGAKLNLRCTRVRRVGN